MYVTDIAKWCEIYFDSSYSNPLYYAKNLYLNGELVTELVIPDSVTSIGDYAFSGCSNFTSVIIPDSVTSIGDSAFNNCCSLTSVIIGNSVTSIGDSAFDNCYYLESITIPDSVTSIGYHAFSGCTSLTSVTIPDSVTSIGLWAFDNCYNLESVYVTDIAKWCEIDFDSSDSNPLYYAKNLCLNGELVTDLVILDGVTSIADFAFYGCTSITSVTIPDSVTNIGDYAFYGCDSLTNVTIPDSVTNIGDYAFYECDSLVALNVVEENATYSSLGGVLFNKDKTVLIQYPSAKTNSTYIVPDGVTSISDEAFHCCSSLTSITIPDSVTSIGYGAFRVCNGLTSIAIPNSVTSIGSYAFVGCSGITSITIPVSVTNIGICAFAYCSPESVYYCGTQEQKLDITIFDGNEDLLNSMWYYNCCIGSAVHTYDNACDTDCSVCGVTREKGHSFEWVIDSENNCGVEGIKHEKCIICHTTRNENTIIPATGNHSWDSDCDETCNVCSFERVIEHSYTNECDRDCNICGNFRKAPHKYDNDCDDTCNLCFAEREVGDHSYTNACDAFCDSCGFERVPSKHVYDNACDKICNICELERTVPAHIYDNVCDAFCNVCEEERIVPQHEYSSVCDTHCDVCDTLRENTLAHTYTNDCDADCNLCSEVRIPSEHKFTNSCDTACNVCGLIRTVSEHSYTLNGNHTCDICKYSKTPNAPVLESKTNNSVTLVQTDGFEYSKDGITWQTSNVFSNLFAETTYTFYQRVKGSDVALVSEISSSLVVVTDEEPVYTVVFKNWDGSVLSTKTYHYGDKVTEPSNPTKVADNMYTYTFSGWDETVVNCEGNATYIATYTPNYIDYTVIFKNYDGTVLSNKTYHYGDTVIVPGTPTKPEDDKYTYAFVGWDSSVVICSGNKTYTATFTGVKKYTPGDIDGVEGVTDADAVYLLYHTFLSDIYPVNQDCDFNGDGEVNDKDAVYLLYYTFLPDLYPIN